MSLLDRIVGARLRTKEREILTDIVKSLGGAPLVYKAIITQSGTNAPIEDDLNGGGAGSPFVDTLKGVWSYSGVGTYIYTKVGAFVDATKVNVVFGENRQNQSPQVVLNAIILNDDSIQVTSATVAYAGGFLTYANGSIYAQPVLMEVY